MINKLIGNYTCDKCKEMKNNLFIKKGTGGIVCVDCNTNLDEYVNNFELSLVDKSEEYYNELIVDIYYNYLIEDAHLFYSILSENGLDYIEMFIDGDVMKRDKLMYQSNENDFIEYMRSVALSFKDMVTDEDFAEMALKWVNRYLELRDRKIGEDEMQYWRLESDLDVSELYIVK